MGKYDIRAKLTSDCKLTVYDLAKEIQNELDLLDAKSIEMQLGNTKSGLLKKLKDILKFDAKNIAKDSKEEQFKMYKLLKILYLIEKHGDFKKIRAYDTTSKVKTPIINILAKPNLLNINTYYSKKTEFGKVFKELSYDIKSTIEDSVERETVFNTIETYWQNLSQYQYRYVLFDVAIDNNKEALIELNKINNSLTNILTLIEKNDVSLALPAEGIMETFYNILLAHERLCYEYDRIKLFNYINMKFDFKKEYTELFKAYEEMYIDLSSISSLDDLLSWADEHKCQEDLYFLLSYGEDISKSDYKHYDFAIKHCGTVIDWIKTEKESLDYSEGVSIALFLSVIQEFINIRKFNNDNIRINYYGYHSVKDSLTSPFSHPEKEPYPALIDVWIRKVETRFCSNYGCYELIVEKNKAEVALSKIKQYILSFRNIRFMAAAHDYLFHQAAVCHINLDLVKTSRQIFEEKLMSILESNGIFIKVLVSDENINRVEEMFRALLAVLIMESNGERYILPKLEKISNQTAQYIIDVYLQKDTAIKEHAIIFSLTKLDGSHRDYFLSFYFDKYNQIFCYKRFGIINTEEEMDILTQIGIIKK